MSEKRLKARKLIKKAIEDYLDHAIILPKRINISSNKTDKSKEIELINNSVVATAILLGLAGSAGTVDLYSLLQVYLLNEKARERINKIVKEERLNLYSTCSD